MMKKHMRSEHYGYSYELPESSFTEPKEDLEPKKSSTGYLALNSSSIFLRNLKSPKIPKHSAHSACFSIPAKNSQNYI